MEYVAGLPHPALTGYVVRYCGYREHSLTPVRRRQAPFAACPLILGFGDALSLYGPAGTSNPTAFLAGLHDGAVITEFTGDQAGVQVELTPLGVYRLFGRPMSELTNACVPLDDLDAPDLANLPTRLTEDADWSHDSTGSTMS